LVPPPVTPSPSAPALWNPFVVGVWGFLLTPAFGSILLMKNWRALGDDTQAKQQLKWCLGFVVFLLLAILTPDTEQVTKVFRSVGFILWVVWSFNCVPMQVRFVKEKYGKNYPHKSWVKPLGSGIACFFVLVFVLSM
jgi:hypothetical protein